MECTAGFVGTRSQAAHVELVAEGGDVAADPRFRLERHSNTPKPKMRLAAQEAKSPSIERAPNWLRRVSRPRLGLRSDARREQTRQTARK